MDITQSNVISQTETPELAAYTSEAATVAPLVTAPSLPPPVKRRKHLPKLRPVHVPVRVHTFDSLRYHNYRMMWAATVFFSGAFWLQQVVVGWLTFDLTGSALYTSIAMGLDALPILLVGPLGGVLVDSFDKRKLLAGIYVYQAAVTLGFSVLVIVGALQAWHIFAFIFLMGVSWVISDPARFALIPNVVPKHNLVNAFALNSMAFSLTRMIAPAAGGALLALVGAGPAIALESGLFLLAVMMSLGLRVDLPTHRMPNIRKVFSEIMEGVSYFKTDRVALGVLLFAAVPPVLVMPFAHGLLPVYAGEIFDVGPTGLGFLMASVGVGSFVGSIALASVGDVRGKGKIIYFGLMVTATGMAVFSVMPWYSSAFLPLMILSGSLMMFFSVSNAAIQSTAPDHLRGRVTSIYILTFGMLPIGSLLAGFVAESLGAPAATLSASIAILVVFAALALKFRVLWRS